MNMVLFVFLRIYWFCNLPCICWTTNYAVYLEEQDILFETGNGDEDPRGLR